MFPLDQTDESLFLPHLDCRLGIGCLHIYTHLMLCWIVFLDISPCLVTAQPHLGTVISRHRLCAPVFLTLTLCSLLLQPSQHSQITTPFIPQIKCRSPLGHYLCFIVASPWIHSLRTLPQYAPWILIYLEGLRILARPAIMW